MSNFLYYSIVAVSLLVITDNNFASASAADGRNSCPNMDHNPSEHCRNGRGNSDCFTDADCYPYKCCRQECGNYLCNTPAPACPPKQCDVQCRNGYAKDSRDCELCTCKPDNLAAVYNRSNNNSQDRIYFNSQDRINLQGNSSSERIVSHLIPCSILSLIVGSHLSYSGQLHHWLT